MEPRFSVTPQPIIAEILAGFVTIILIGVGYCVRDPRATEWLLQLSASKLIGVGGAVFILAWIIGTFLDTCRDCFEWILDLRWEINWQFLISTSAENIDRLNDWYLAYYLLNANCVVGILVALAFASSGLIVLPSWGYVVVAVFGFVNLLGAIVTRAELRELMGTSLPHACVFTRLRPSDVHPGGVGVFAIRDIQKGTYLFEPDDLPVVAVDAARVDDLPPELRKLYYDFGTLNDANYTVPTSFNKLSVGWYLNEPARGDLPNVKCDKNLHFYAATDIEAGTELLVNYDEYCERPPEDSQSVPKGDAAED